jgi:hypothetical protein
MHHSLSRLFVPSPASDFSTASLKDGAKRVVFPRDFLVVKLRSFERAMPVEAAVNSLVRHMVLHDFATGLIAPSPTNAFPTASWQDGAKSWAIFRVGSKRVFFIMGAWLHLPPLLNAPLIQCSLPIVWNGEKMGVNGVYCCPSPFLADFGRTTRVPGPMMQHFRHGSFVPSSITIDSTSYE